MKIAPITSNYYNYNRTNLTDKKNVKTYNTQYSPSFGYCDIHLGRMRTLNENISKSIKQNFEKYNLIKKQFDTYNEKLKFMENAHKQAAFLVTQYTNYQYSLAEVIPSYALECSTEAMRAIEETQIFNTPQEILLTIANIPKLETRSGIDKNTGKSYTQEQVRKSRASSQLYSTVMMLDLLDKKLADAKLKTSDKNLVINMRNSVLKSISSIYGEDAYSKIQRLKMMGINASLEDKRASLKLLQEFDSKAKELDFGRDFYTNLDKLLRHQETLKTGLEENLNQEIATLPKVTLHYHTHPHEHNHDHSHHAHHTHQHSIDNEHDEYSQEHSHEYMHEHGIAHSHSNNKNLVVK